ncbi:hypothetical protein CROQUDRAFT_715521 [Cronartium quercuum f. sp. fusiforme G11]|uniref:Uncharacterized protein n=1 Tax=Cronartium quercuum f. sp. fusiforme G11 TaxID=708437 RepID=A0A9P6TCB8_9BASI|nr:hypothetical protein CROQUDRAFT_715521 [Cronartium quercuum f. sp. fusiforme G11]
MRPVPVFLIVALAAQLQLFIEVDGANLTYCVEHHKSDKLDQFNKLEDCKDFCKKQPNDCQTYCAQHAHDNEWPCKSETSSNENATVKSNNPTQGTPQNGVNPGQTTTPSANNLSPPATSQSHLPYSDTSQQAAYRGGSSAPHYIDASAPNPYHGGDNPNGYTSGFVPPPNRGEKKNSSDHIFGNDGHSTNPVANILPDAVVGDLVGDILPGTTGLLDNIGSTTGLLDNIGRTTGLLGNIGRTTGLLGNIGNILEGINIGR